MPENLNPPSAYIEDIPSGVRMISGVSTSVALFIGRAAQGPLDQTVKCLKYSDYDDVFSSDSTLGELSDQVKLFFSNGGLICYVIRIERFQQAEELVENSMPPELSDYEHAFSIADQEIDLFNLMILPRDAASAQLMSDLYGPASVFCSAIGECMKRGARRG